MQSEVKFSLVVKASDVIPAKAGTSTLKLFKSLIYLALFTLDPGLRGNDIKSHTVIQ